MLATRHTLHYTFIFLAISYLIATYALSNASLAYAAGDMTSQTPIIKTIQLSNSKNELRFYPSTLAFETGKLYKLVIYNPSNQKHYFSAADFARSVFTRKVQVMNPLTKMSNIPIAEVKGSINEIEVYPGGTTEWWFVPVKTLDTSRLNCSIKGHTQAGMTGTIVIK